MRNKTIYLAILVSLALGAAGVSAQEDVIDATLEACDTEIKTYCSQVTPGEGRLLACFFAHGDKLSGRCEYALYSAAAELEQFAAAVTYLAEQCLDDLEKHCGEVEIGEGRVESCLLEHKDEVSEGCRKAIDDTELEGAAAPMSAQDPGLVQTLTGQLGVTETQAAGGAAAILGLAKSNLGSSDYLSLAKAVPEVGDLLGSATTQPSAESGSGLSSTLAAAASALGAGDDDLAKAAGLASLAGAFSDLGLDSEMIGKFVPVILEYVGGKGGDSNAALLKTALGLL